MPSLGLGCLLWLVIVFVVVEGTPFGCDRTRSASAPGAADPSSGVPPQSSKAAGGDLKNEEEEYAQGRRRMVESLAAAGITDQRVLEVMGRIPRHEFVPSESRRQSYQDTALPIAENQNISQPYIVALMTQLLALKSSDKVLEIGTGSGYQAAILAELVPDGEVYSVEILPALSAKAAEKLEELRKRGILHSQELKTIRGDGSHGYPPAAPYDAILATAAPRKLPVELLNQLKPGGRLVIPVGDYYQELQLIRKREDGTYSEETVASVRFVPLVEE